MLNQNDIELTNYEKKEIVDYKNIYYIGKLEYKIQNGIYSKDNRFIIKINDHIKYRYKILKQLGYGSYSNVVKVLDYKNGEEKVIKSLKKFKNIDNIEKKEIEINKILLKRNKNLIVEFLDFFTFRDFKFLIFKLYSNNLYKDRYKIYESSIFDKITIIKDLFEALTYFRNGRPKIIHADLKPENILFKNKTDFNIVICDFGLSILLNRDYYYNHKQLVQTRYYRAPEICYKIPFNEKIDIWSIGCIIYEIIEETPLFPCKCDEDLMVHIHNILGSPPINYINSDILIKIHYNRYIPKINKTKLGRTLLPLDGSILLDKYFELPLSNIENKVLCNLIKLIYKCLEYDISSRIHSFNALKFINNEILILKE